MNVFTSRNGFVVVLMLVASLSGCEWTLDAGDRIARAETKVAAHDDQGALIDLQNALREEPGNGKARLMVAEIALRQGDAAQAQSEYSRALAAGVSPETAAELGAKINVAAGEFEALLKQIDNGELRLNEPLKGAYRGVALQRLGRGAEAIAAFEGALAIDPQLSLANIGLAEMYASEGRSDDALQLLAKVTAANDKDALAWLTKGVLLAGRGEYADAIQALKKAKETAAGQLSTPRYFLLLASLAESQLASNELAAAKQTHAELAKRSADWPLTRLLGARIALVEQNYTVAVAEAQNAVTAAPDFSQAKLILGAALLGRGSYNQAETYLREVVRDAPENVEARKLLAQVNLRLQRPDAALQALTPAQTSNGDPQVDALMGLANLQEGNRADAIVLLERSYKAQPTNKQVRTELAAAYLQDGRSEEAVRLLKDSAAARDVRSDALLISALAAQEGGLAKANAEMMRIVEANPKDLDVLNMAAMFHLRQGDSSRARDLLNRALAIDPKHAATSLTLARLETGEGKLDQARAVLERADAANSKNANIRLALAENLVLAKRPDDAIKLLQTLREEQPESVPVRMTLARLYLHASKPAEADSLLAELKKASAGDAGIINAIGQIYADSRRYEEALREFSEAARMAKDEPSYWFNAARAQLALGNSIAARESAGKSVAVDPAYVPANVMLVMLDSREKRFDAASTRVAQLKKLRPKDANVVVLEGDVALQRGAYPAAADSYAQAVALRSTTQNVLRLYRARSAGKLPGAQSALEDRLKHEPGDTTIRMVLAEYLAAQGQVDRAVRELEHIAEGPTPNPMALNNLAWLYHEKSDPRARATAKQAYDALPDSPPVADTYGWILVQGGQVNEGLPILKRAAEGPKPQPDVQYHYAYALARSGNIEQAKRELIALTRSEVAYASKAEAVKLLRELGG
jgi:putative PEP-CTERM system TPR-repeat lipoprotein